MQFNLRREYAQLLPVAGQIALIFLGLRIATRQGWLICLPLIALLGVFAWNAALRRLRAIRDTPTSRIASAAQGYVELIGRGMPFGDLPLLSRLRQLPCLWYRYTIEERTRNDSRSEWRTIDSGESPDSFMLRDSSGECVVDPEHAEITTTYKETWNDGDMRYTEWTLLKENQIYVLGEFRTRSCAVEFDSNAELNDLLAEWKKDMPALRKRFDLNNDGELDMAEWMLARKAAQREVAKKRLGVETQPDINIISQPRDGSLYLISNLTPLALSRRYLMGSWVHVTIIFFTIVASAWMLQSK